MTTFLQRFLNDLKNYKIYHIILVFTAIFIIIFLNGLYHIQEELKTIANQNRLLVTKEIQYTIASWIDERVNNLESNVKYLSKQNHFEQEDEVRAFLQILLQDKHYFDTVQVLVEGYYFYVNEKKYFDFRKDDIFIDKETGIEPLKTPWHLSTMQSKQTTISIMEKHGHLKEKTVNICTPLIKNEQAHGSLCGIIKVSSLFEKINDIDFPQNSYYFIMDSSGNVLKGISDDKVKAGIESYVKSNNRHMEQQKFIIDKDVVTLSKIRNFDWYIGVGMSKEDIMQTSTQKVTKHAIILFACFVLLIIIANSAHAFLQRRIEKRQKQYEFMLTHRSRIAQIGKLMSGINHQLRQPLNAITLIISNTLDMSERNILDKSTLEENLHLCHTSVALMDKTIDTFRNFYRCGETISEFAVKECVQGVLYVMHVDLSRSNINVVMQVQDNAHIKANSIENYIQQILLVLIQNAKDALISKIEKSGKQKIAMQTIYIDIAQQEEQIIIDVKDFGEGISATETETLFTELKSSRKNQGSGIGLYFAKKLANEKLSGDLSLIHRASPTIFRLIFSQNLISRSRTDTGLFKQGLCGNIQ